MRRCLWLLVAAVLLGGCASQRFTVSEEAYRAQVRTLGVAPILVDRASNFDHPERERVIELMERAVRGAEEQLVERLRAQQGYFDVRRIEADPQELLPLLVKASEAAGDGASLHLRYAFSTATVAELCERHGVDALAIIVLHGVKRVEKQWDRAALSATFLEAPFNVVTASAAVVDSHGKLLWELADAPTLLYLEFPSFDEAYYNRSDRVPVYPIRSDGLERRLAAEETSRRSEAALFPALDDLIKRIARDLDARSRRPF